MIIAYFMYETLDNHLLHSGQCSKRDDGVGWVPIINLLSDLCASGIRWEIPVFIVNVECNTANIAATDTARPPATTRWANIRIRLHTMNCCLAFPCELPLRIALWTWIGRKRLRDFITKADYLFVSRILCLNYCLPSRRSAARPLGSDILVGFDYDGMILRFYLYGRPTCLAPGR